MKNHILTITDLLLGAAYADKRLEGQEKDKIRSLLAKLLGSDSFPAEVEARFKGFSPAKFDVDAAGKKVSHLGDDRRKILEMVAAVTESDEEIDQAEDRYLRRVAAAMGLKDQEVNDLLVDFDEIDELDGVLS
jgi:uncharacterized tellurite resistance protein B-like protein